MKKILLLLILVISLIFTERNEPTDLPNDAAVPDKAIASSNDKTIKTSKPLAAKKKPVIALVNRSNRLDKNFVPAHLVIPNVKFTTYASAEVKKMDSEAALALESLFRAAKADAITLLAVSGYRNYKYQNMLYRNQVTAVGKKEADKYVAQPGASEHQTGLAMDVLSNEYSSLDEGFANTKAYKWLVENCYEYGFIIRYPKGKESITGYNYEPWHLRYVGISAATKITQKRLTLEEYLGIFA
ncbi:M15 family metallopeptidase [Clostridium sp.]|uniref:M15 family metallopeptidase n=1 Tax=Clostridium sp. TaxID=1506 RepID=UPI002FC88850